MSLDPKCNKRNVTDIELLNMISALNKDLLRVFEKVEHSVQSENTILRLYVSGAGGTGKSFSIDVKRCWVQNELKKKIIVTAPTGIAAFNIDGITIYKAFQLPVEHGYACQYYQLSDNALKVLRSEFHDVILIIIDEISMVLSVVLLYIHLRLMEIFNTVDQEDGWFGKIHILVFGDLLQLPPVQEDPAFVDLSSKKIEKFIGSLGNSNLWKNLFSYDELILNMRQKTDSEYNDLLARLRVGATTSYDVKLLEQRKKVITHVNSSIVERIKELSDYINKLPEDTVCLLPTCCQCDILNSTMTAGLAKKIKVKLGAKIMIRRNIDVTLGLVNGTIGKIMSISESTQNDQIDSITIQLANKKEYTIERISAKFQVMNNAYVIRKQFPLCLSYGITIHKSQGLSLTNAVIDVGNRVFTSGQTYVALSRITTLKGLHLINFDPFQVKASSLAISKYNRLRVKYKPELLEIALNERRLMKVLDLQWAVNESDIPDNSHNLSEQI
ncbi:ATP-dependent DNA helicase PIF1-like [Chelonus insularis]|uniref:ATP-dependent DNA helicase PIF1-like n=1 Tax=Chelonus insularis TaxID=460826 RepID=UPI00158F1CBB|nr:ATP-dependent DNA helicase PIF1-like [Chelonus insularis]